MNSSRPRKLILASTSRFRAALLDRLQLDFEAVAPPYEERNDPSQAPAQLVLEQAEGKAQSLADQFPDALVIGSDQVATLGGEILTKPGTRAAAIDQLTRLSGHEHRLLTAVVTIDTSAQRTLRHLETSPIGVRSLSSSEIEAYVDAEEPWDCAGSYKAESLGVSLFEYQRGDDPTAVVGLPLIQLCHQLRQLGVLIP